jgi:hypothetical protein
MSESRAALKPKRKYMTKARIEAERGRRVTVRFVISAKEKHLLETKAWEMGVSEAEAIRWSLRRAGIFPIFAALAALLWGCSGAPDVNVNSNSFTSQLDPDSGARDAATTDGASVLDAAPEASPVLDALRVSIGAPCSIPPNDCPTPLTCIVPSEYAYGWRTQTYTDGGAPIGVCGIVCEGPSPGSANQSTSYEWDAGIAACAAIGGTCVGTFVGSVVLEECQ